MFESTNRTGRSKQPLIPTDAPKLGFNTATNILVGTPVKAAAGYKFVEAVTAETDLPVGIVVIGASQANPADTGVTVCPVLAGTELVCKSAEAITAGDTISFSGAAADGTPTVKKTGTYIVGVAVQNIPANTEGYVMLIGIVKR